MRFEGDWGKLWAKIQFYRQSMTKYMAKSKNIKKKKKKKKEQDQKTLISAFA